MKKLISQIVRKDLSRAKFYAGANLKEYFTKTFNALHNPKFNISMEILSEIVEKDEYIKYDKPDDENPNISLKKEFYETKEYLDNEEELYNYAYIKNLYKEEINTIILLVYKLIIDHGTTNYLEIEKTLNKINPSLKIDKKLTSHYCKELKKLNLIYKMSNASKSNERVVQKINTANLYNKIIPKEMEDSDEEEGVEAETAGEIDFKLIKNFYKYSEDPKKILELRENEKSIFGNLLNVSKTQMENRFSFLIDNNVVDNNIFFHLLLNKETGLTSNEIVILLGLFGREKAIVRILSNFEKKGYIKHVSVRKGKKYEFVYRLCEDFEVQSQIRKMVEFYKNQKGQNFMESVSHENNMTRLKTPEKSNMNKMIFDDEIPIQENKKPSLKNDTLIQTQMKQLSTDFSKIQSTKFVELNNFDYAFIINQILSDEKYSKLKEKFNIQSVENSLQFSPETKLNLVLDFFFINLTLLKVRTLDDVSFNRYIFCLNKIFSEKVISLNNLKMMIMKDLECDIGFTMDRKTLRNVIKNLESCGFIKTMEFELVMKNQKYLYEGSREEIVNRKIVAIKRDLNLTEDMIRDIEESLKPRQKTSQNTNLKISESHFDEMDLDFTNVNTIKKEINNLLSNVELSVSYSEKNIMQFIKIFENCQKRRNDKYFNNFFECLKRLYFTKQNLIYLFSQLKRKETEKKVNIQSIPYFKLLETCSPQKVILPKFMLNNILNTKEEKKKIVESNNSDTNNNDIAYLISGKNEPFDNSQINSEKSIQLCINLENKSNMSLFNDEMKLTEEEIQIANKYFCSKNENKNDIELESQEFLKNKRSRNKNENMLLNNTKVSSSDKKYRKFNPDDYNKIINFYPFLSKIYFNPKITLKKLKHSLFNSVPAEMVCTDFILFLNKIGVLKISNLNTIGNTMKYIRLDDEISLELNKSLEKFIDF